MNRTDKAPKNRSSFSGFLLLSLALAVIFIIVVLMPLEPSDYWTYLRIGDQIARTHAIPATEFMTYTSGGQPALYSYWLASLAFLGISKAGGFALTALVMGVCVIGLYLFIWLCLRELNLGPVSACLVLFVTALMGSNNWSTRPQNFALPLFGLTLLILLKWLQGHNILLWLLPLISLLWVNLHGSYILLFVLLVLALIFGSGSRTKLLIIIGFSLAATFINPYGFHLWTNTAGMIGSNLIKTYSSEWQPPMNQGWQLNLFFGSLLVMALVAAYSKVRVKLFWWVLFLGFGWMALSSIRYVLWFSLIECLLLAQLAAPWLDRFLDTRPVFPQRAFNLTLGVLMLVLPLVFLPGIRQRWWAKAPAVVTDTTPVEAVNWIKTHPELPEHIWANWVACIYMSYTLPERPVWITNRIEDFNEQIFLDKNSLMRASYDWATILERYKVKTLLLDKTYNQSLISAVELSPDWHDVYQDESQIIFTKSAQN